MLARNRYDHSDFIHDPNEQSVKLVEGAMRRWLMDLEANLHAMDEDHPSLQVLMVERVRELVDDLPRQPSIAPASDGGEGESQAQAQ